MGSNCESLWLGEAYCVGVSGPASTTAVSTTSKTSVSIPGPTQAGITSACTEFYLTVESKLIFLCSR